MQVSSATIPGISPATTNSAPPAERSEKRENDADGDDRRVGGASSQSRSVNLSGQVTGLSLIHI